MKLKNLFFSSGTTGRASSRDLETVEVTKDCLQRFQPGSHLMRLWTLHPQYPDSKGIVALWREALLARKVPAGKTRGYRHHPQLERFRSNRSPLQSTECYLWNVYEEAVRRGYRFDRSKVHRPSSRIRIKTTVGQLRFEVLDLKRKLRRCDRHSHRRLKRVRRLEPHPSFRIVPGPIEHWEKTG